MKKTGFMLLTVLLNLAMQAAALEIRCGIPPLISVVRAVGGERVHVKSMLTGSQEPHTYSPSPKTVADARGADLFLTIGMPFEHVVAEKLKAMNSSLPVVDVSAGLIMSGDPHVWMSLSNLSRMAAAVEQALSRIDPDGADSYRKNRGIFQQRLAEQNEKLTQMLKPLQGVTFYVAHPVLGYFARDYGLKQDAVELEEKKPSAKQLLDLIDKAHTEKVRVVFVEPQFSQKPARIIAERINGTVFSINPLAEDPSAVLERAAEILTETYAVEKTDSSAY